MSLLTSAVSMTKAMVQIDSTDPGTYEKAMADWIEQHRPLNYRLHLFSAEIAFQTPQIRRFLLQSVNNVALLHDFICQATDLLLLPGNFFFPCSANWTHLIVSAFIVSFNFSTSGKAFLSL